MKVIIPNVQDMSKSIVMDFQSQEDAWKFINNEDKRSDRTNEQKIFAAARDYLNGIICNEQQGNVMMVQTAMESLQRQFNNRSVGQTFNNYDGDFTITETDLRTINRIRERMNQHMMEHNVKRSQKPLFKCLRWLERYQG